MAERRGPSSSEKDSLISRVGHQDNYNCQSCSAIVLPKGNVGHTMYALNEKEEPGVSDYITVCFDCMEWKPEREVARKIETAERLRNAPRGVNGLYARKLLRTLTERTRLFVYAGRALFVRRLGVILVALVVVLVAIGGLGMLVGTLFISVETGLRWVESILQSVRIIGTFLTTRPWILFAGLALVYAVHISERERDYLRGVHRERRRGGGRDLPNYHDYTYPRWQLLAACSSLTFLGMVDWLALSLGFREGSPLGASLLWLTGGLGLTGMLRAALREDRDASGFTVRPTPWVVGSRIAFVLGAIEITTTLTGRLLLSPVLTQTGFYLLPIVGVSYVLRRTIERRTGWRLALPLFTGTTVSDSSADQPPEQHEHDHEYTETQDSDQ